MAPVVKNLPANAGRCKRSTFDPWVGKIPWRRAWQPTPVFLPEESRGQRSLWATQTWPFFDPQTLCDQRVTKSWAWLKWLSTHTGIMPLIVIAWRFKALIQLTKASDTEYKVSAWVISVCVCVHSVMADFLRFHDCSLLSVSVNGISQARILE